MKRFITTFLLSAVMILSVVGCSSQQPDTDIVPFQPSTTTITVTSLITPISSPSPTPLYTPTPTLTPIPMSTLSPTPTPIDVYKEMAYQALESQNYTDAINYYSKAIDLGSDDYSGLAMVYNARGERYIKFGDTYTHDKAIFDFTQAIKYAPNNPGYYYNRGDVYYLLVDYYNSWDNKAKVVENNQKAILDFSKAISLNSDNDNVYLFRGHCYCVAGDNAKAILDYKKSIELGFSIEYAYMGLAGIYAETNNKSQALLYYQKAYESTLDSDIKEFIKNMMNGL